MHCDWSTDSGNVEVEPFLVMHCDPHIQDGRVHVCNRLFAVRQPVSGNAEGLFDCLHGGVRLEEQVSRTRL